MNKSLGIVGSHTTGGNLSMMQDLLNDLILMLLPKHILHLLSTGCLPQTSTTPLGVTQDLHGITHIDQGYLAMFLPLLIGTLIDDDGEFTLGMELTGMPLGAIDYIDDVADHDKALA